ncbi:uncharacterized protein L199_008680 [Kwoniella botswanensis]|uniref:uncharacterized protein n=1 Tax=Kwoniella botswanensis TaxID=1268659 RepID=UPI00315D03A0
MLFVAPLLPLLSLTSALSIVNRRDDTTYKHASLELTATGKCLTAVQDQNGDVIDGFQFVTCTGDTEWSVFKPAEGPKQIGFISRSFTPVLDAGDDGKPHDVSLEKPQYPREGQKWLINYDGRISTFNGTLCLSQTKGAHGDPSIRAEGCGSGEDNKESNILQVWKVVEFHGDSSSS